MEIKYEDKREQDYITNKILIVFTMVFLGIFATVYLLKMSNYKAESFLLAHKIIDGLTIASIVSFLAGIAKTMKDKKQKIKMKFSYLTGKNIVCVSTIWVICCLVIQKFSIFTASKYIYAFLTSVAILYFIFESYTKDVFMLSFSNIINLLLIFVIGKSPNNSILLATSLASIVFLLFNLAISKMAQSKNGELFKNKFFLEETNYKNINANAIILIAISIASSVLAYIGYPIGIFIAVIYIIVAIFYSVIKIF